ncbi:SAV_915 family protein [Actinacidiphila glaucinigra]|uniref:SAV_915 family protein n=1 Tax=Actinacidiphila glaucinigra TaxID=235986 RepID=UPI002E312783|nr:SAV_915 family protein [Actinacidiphila glaucinigra]
MTELTYGDDPEPSDPSPAGRHRETLYVPVRPGPVGCVARMFRTPLGGRTAVGFTTAERLAETLGPEQQWIPLSESALRSLARPLGVTALTVDPQLAAPAVSDMPEETGRRLDPQTLGVLRVTGAVAQVDALALWIG